jgi:Domain of unknown function (DUF4157)
MTRLVRAASVQASAGRTGDRRQGGEDRDVRAAAEHGISGSGGALPHLGKIQRSFGRHDVSGVKAHTDRRAAAGAEAMGAEAFATGDHVAFSGQPDLHTAAHEAAHVVQQRGGVQLKGGVGEVGDPHERHADAVADLVVQGKSAEALLDGYGKPGAKSSSGAIQRHVFVGGRQLTKDDPAAIGAGARWVSDDVVRSYTSEEEFQQHAGGGTDYLGNLPDGTWMRFDPTGLNLLGEAHTEVTMSMVVRAVGSKNFIREGFSNDDFREGSAMKSAYDSSKADDYKQLGIDNEKDKRRFGAESVYPKLGQAMTYFLMYLEDPEKGVASLADRREYVGKPVQTYLKLAWADAKDCEAQAAELVGPPTPNVAALLEVRKNVEGDLEPFITALPDGGYIGEELAKPGNEALLPQLKSFAKAVVDLAFERAMLDPTSRLTPEQSENIRSGKTSKKEDLGLFNQWRNSRFEETIKNAAARGVRYAGMGVAHLNHLEKVGLPENAHPYHMASGGDIESFKRETMRLLELAIEQRENAR